MRIIRKDNKGEAITIAAFFVLFAAVAITFQIFEPTFLTWDSVTTMLKTGATTAIAALGLTFVIVVSHSDISFYMTSCFSSMFMAWLISLKIHPIIAVAGGLLMGFIWGGISGIAVGKFKLPDIISTIAIGSIAFGAAYVFSDGAFIYEEFHTSGIINLSEHRFLGITVSVWIMLVLYIIAYFALDRSKIGRWFYSTGANKRAAFFSGVRVNQVIIAAFIVSGVLAALAAIIYDAAQGQGNVKIGMNFLMPCFSAIYIGWSVFKKPCVIGTFFGALISTVITTGFTVMSIPYYYSDLTMAGVLILAIGLSKMQFKSKESDIAKPDDKAEGQVAQA
ncbi:MAG: ABC transporter permease [Lachnospiraceae bacterium]|jgi:ribose/xylose/arabinose/galactoside ABC-type transport system permease subunit|nr:ABC transporter permease [Lachnospiraceae bacterium]